MPGQDWEFRGQDGTTQRGRYWAPMNGAGDDVGGEVRGLVYLVHGLAEHIDRYDRFARYLSDRGFAVAGHDQRGHGRSVTADAPLGHFGDGGGWNTLVDDAIRGMSALRDQAGDHPLILFGHSMGSFVVQQVLWTAAEGLSGAVLSGSNGPPPPLAALGRVIARIERMRLGAKGSSSLLHGLGFDGMNKAFQPSRTPMDWLSRDPAEVDRYIADPLCGFVASTGSWITLLDALKGLTAASHVARIPKDLPIHLAAGSRDPVGDSGRGVQRLAGVYRAAGLQQVSVTLYPDARHEILNETGRDQVMADLAGHIRTMADRSLAGRTMTGGTATGATS